MMTLKEETIAATCPVCEGGFEPAGQTLELGETLRRWEQQLGSPLGEEVWRQYASNGSPRTVTLYRCGRCQFALFQPVVTGSREFYAAITDQEGHCYTPEKWEFRQAVKDIKRHGCRTVLDIGSGSGHFLGVLRESCPEVSASGFEFNPEMAALGRAKGHHVFEGQLPDAVLAATGGRLFDAVCLFQVIEHVADPVGFIESALRLLDERGLLIVGVPDAAGPLRHFADDVSDVPPHHVSRWSEPVFRVGLRRLGLEVERVAYEPLPSYLWSFYLPEIVNRDLRPKVIGRAVNRLRLVPRLIRLLNFLGVKWLHGVPGHTVYAALRRSGK